MSRPEPDSCERLLCCASPLGLYAEEIDTETGRHPGNFPQAFTYLALINALLHLIEGERAEEEDTSASPARPRTDQRHRREPTASPVPSD